MISLSCGSEPWWKGKSLGHRGSRARVFIIQWKSVLCPANPTEIEQKFTFHMVSHLQDLKVKSTLLSIYELLSALVGSARGQCHHHTAPWPNLPMHTGENTGCVKPWICRPIRTHHPFFLGTLYISVFVHFQVILLYDATNFAQK